MPYPLKYAASERKGNVAQDRKQEQRSVCPFDTNSGNGIPSRYSSMRRLFLIFIILGAIALTLSAQYQNSFKVTWIEPGSDAILPEFDAFDSVEGTLGVLNASGPVNTEGHPFFTALGTNGRACVNCHQPTYGMSVSVAGLVERWRSTDGKDPVFAAFDGSNCPGLPQDQESSHSLLLKRGLFRIPLSWPPRNADGSPKPVEFTIEVVRDPTGCNTSPEYGLKSAEPTISVYRRPRPAANLKYVISGGPAYRPQDRHRWPTSIPKPASPSA